MILSEKIEQNFKKIYQDEAARGTLKNLCGYRKDLLAMSFPEEIRNLSLGLWHPLSFFCMGKDNPARVLDCGCGSGFDLYYLYNVLKNNSKYYGIDLCPDLLIRGQDVLGKHQFFPFFSAGRIYEIPFKNDYFDLVMAHASVHLARDRKLAFSEVYRVLNPDGAFLVCDPVYEGEMPDSFREEFEFSGGMFLYGGLLSLKDYYRMSETAGFKFSDLIDRTEFDPLSEMDSLLRKRFGEKYDSLKEKVSFSIITAVFYKNQYHGFRKIRCQSCSKEYSAAFASTVDLMNHPELTETFLKRKLNFSTCPFCRIDNDCLEPFLCFFEDGTVCNKLPEKLKNSEMAFPEWKNEKIKIETIFSERDFFRKLKKPWWKRYFQF